MRISKDSKIGVALSVLRKVSLQAKNIAISTYSNCREQGFFIVSYLGNDWRERRAVSFAEHRNSDDIVVQYGISDDFDAYGVLSEEKYNGENSKEYFRYDDHEGAAEFISKWLKG